MARAPSPPPKGEKAVAAAGGFTGLWALAWMGATAAGTGAGAQGGFAVGAVMASSGLTLLWWKTRTLAALAARHEEGAEGEEGDGLSASPTQKA